MKIAKIAKIAAIAKIESPRVRRRISKLASEIPHIAVFAADGKFPRSGREFFTGYTTGSFAPEPEFTTIAKRADFHGFEIHRSSLFVAIIDLLFNLRSIRIDPVAGRKHMPRTLEHGSIYFVLLCACSLLGLDRAAASTPGAPPHQALRASRAGDVITEPLRVKTRLISVDAVVTDSNGKPVAGLTGDDFELWEDGKRQAIKGFYSASSQPEETEPTLQPVPGSYTNISSFRRERGAAVIVLIDMLNTRFHDVAYARAQLQDYLSKLGSGRNVAVYVLGLRLQLVQSFTTDQSILQQAIANRSNWRPTLPSDPSSSPGFSAGSNQSAASNASPLAMERLQAASIEGASTELEVDLRMHTTLDALRSIARQAQGIPGRKTMIWLTDGPPFSSFATISGTPFHDKFSEAGKILTDARVAIYPIDARGLVAFDPKHMQAGMAELVNAHFGMNDIAGWTGGRAFYERNDLDRAIATAVDEGSSYYTLQYYPTNKNWNGEFRAIQVKVLRKGLQVRCRRGYFANDWAKPKPAQTKAALKEFADALSAESLSATGLPLVATVVPPGKDQRQVWVDVNVDPHAVLFEEKDSRHHSKLEFVTVVQDATGKKITIKVDVLNSDLTPETLAKVMAGSLAIRQKFDLAAGKYVLCIGVRDMKSNLIGSLTAPVEVPSPPPN